ncbi:hypothetical protein J6590_066160 [Homalodisca vitripennis]|nr:hypothetical protein J6590_066160 [Homalodisca vitripennis]
MYSGRDTSLSRSMLKSGVMYSGRDTSLSRSCCGHPGESGDVWWISCQSEHSASTNSAVLLRDSNVGFTLA